MTCNKTKETYLLTECFSVNVHENLLVKSIKLKKAAKGVLILCDKIPIFKEKNVFNLWRSFNYRLLPTENGNADRLFESLRAVLEEDDTSWDRVVGYPSDGENLIQGQSNSFLTRMNEVLPHLFVLKSFCHSFDFAAKHAWAAHSRAATIHSGDVYNYFKYAPNRLKSYEEFQAFVHESRTRFWSHAEPDGFLLPSA